MTKDASKLMEKALNLSSKEMDSSGFKLQSAPKTGAIKAAAVSLPKFAKAKLSAKRISKTSTPYSGKAEIKVPKPTISVSKTTVAAIPVAKLPEIANAKDPTSRLPFKDGGYKKKRRGYAVGGNPVDPNQQYRDNLIKAGFSQSVADSIAGSQRSQAAAPVASSAPNTMATSPVPAAAAPLATAQAPVAQAPVAQAIAPVSSAPVLSQNENLIPEYRSNYVYSVLGRDITPEENTQWQNYLDTNALNDQQIKNYIYQSPEAQQYLPTTIKEYRNDFVNRYLGRDITDEENQSWQNYIDNMGLSNDQIKNAIASSEDATNHFINQEYNNYIGRDALPEERSAWVEAFKNGVNKDALSNAFYNNEYSKDYLNKQFVNNFYKEYKGRDATPEELAMAKQELGPDKTITNFLNKTFPEKFTEEGFDIASNAKSLKGIKGSSPERSMLSNLWNKIQQVDVNSLSKGAKDFLNFISGGEGSYNSVNKGSNKPYTHDASQWLGKPLTSFSIGDIMKKQKDGDIFATGKFQIIPRTLKDIVDKYGIDKSTMYDEETQEKLGLLLAMDRPGLRDYLLGRSNNISKANFDAGHVWASLPNPKTGQSYYGHGNKAQHTPEATLDALRNARGSVQFMPGAGQLLGGGAGTTPPSGGGGGTTRPQPGAPSVSDQKSIEDFYNQYLYDNQPPFSYYKMGGDEIIDAGGGSTGSSSGSPPPPPGMGPSGDFGGSGGSSIGNTGSGVVASDGVGSGGTHTSSGGGASHPVTHTGGVSHSPVHTGSNSGSFSVGYQTDPYFGHAGVGGSDHIGGATHTSGSDPYFGHSSGSRNDSWYEQDRLRGMSGTDAELDAMKKRGGRLNGKALKLTKEPSINDTLRLAKETLSKRHTYKDGGGKSTELKKKEEEKTPGPNLSGVLNRLYELNNSGQIDPDTEFKHDPNDPKYNISPYEYRKGNLPFGKYALADGGRAKLADGGDAMQQYAANLKAAGMSQAQIDAIIGSQTQQAPATTAAPAAGSNPATATPVTASVTAAPTTAAQPQTTATAPVTTAAPTTTAAQPQVSDLLTKYYGSADPSIASYINQKVQDGTYTMPQVDAWLQTPEAKSWYTGATAPAATTQKSGASPSLQTAAATPVTATATTPSVTSLSSLPAKSTVFIQGNPYYITTPEEAAQMKANGTLPKNVMYYSGLQSLGMNNLIATGSNDFGGTHYVAYTPQTAAQYGLTYSANPTTTTPTTGGTTPTTGGTGTPTGTGPHQRQVFDQQAYDQAYQQWLNGYNQWKQQADVVSWQIATKQLGDWPSWLPKQYVTPQPNPASYTKMITESAPSKDVMDAFSRVTLGRDVSDTEAQQWADYINKGLSNQQIFAAMSASPEAANYTKYQINDIYSQATGNPLTKDQVDSVYNDMAAGKFTLSQLDKAWNNTPQADAYRQQQVNDLFTTATGLSLTPEQSASISKDVQAGKYTLPQLGEAWATSVPGQQHAISDYWNELTGKDLTPEQSSQLNAALTNKTYTPEQITDAMENSPEAISYNNQQLLNDTFDGYGVEPTTEQFNKYLNALNKNELTLDQVDKLVSESPGAGSGEILKPYEIAGKMVAPSGIPNTPAKINNYISSIPSTVQQEGKKLLSQAMDYFGITNPNVRNVIGANVQVETGFGPGLEKSYQGTSNDRIKKIFSETKGMSNSELNALKSNDKAFFNKVYGHKNGNEGGDDGYNYRGRGAVQLTGKANYLKYGNLAGYGDELVKNPDLMMDPTVSAKVSVAYMKDMLEHGKGRNDFDKITKGVNAFGPTVAQKRAVYRKLPKDSEFNTKYGEITPGTSTPKPTPKPDYNYKYGKPSEADIQSIAKFLGSQGIGVTTKGGATPTPTSGYIIIDPSQKSLLDQLTRAGAGGSTGGGTGGGGTGSGTPGIGTGTGGSYTPPYPMPTSMQDMLNSGSWLQQNAMQWQMGNQAAMQRQKELDAMSARLDAYNAASINNTINQVFSYLNSLSGSGIGGAYAAGYGGGEAANASNFSGGLGYGGSSGSGIGGSGGGSSGSGGSGGGSGGG